MYIPQIFGTMPVKIWAPPLVAGSMVPAVGAVVWCMFQGGDPSYPTYLPPVPPGAGAIPAGGTTNQVLAKNSNTNYDTKWSPAPVVSSGGVVSVGSNPPAGTPMKHFSSTYVATTSAFGTITITPPAGVFTYGYLPIAMVGDVAPTSFLGCTVNLANSSMTSLFLMIWNNNDGVPANTAVRVNIMWMGA
jgi:hypothetical protein